MSIKKETLLSFSKIVIRTPLQPIDRYSYCFENNLDTLIQNATPLFSEGLYLSSPEFLVELDKLQGSADGKKDYDKILNSYRKYWVRSCTRATPYATFAGCGLVAVEGNTDIVLDDSEPFSRRVRIDMNYLTMLINRIAGDPSIQKHLLFYPNNSLYELPRSYRYVDYVVKGSDRFYQLQEVGKEKYLEVLLGSAQKGAGISSLADTLIRYDPTLGEEEVLSFILELIASQLLISELEPPLTGINPLKGLIAKLKKYTPDHSFVSQLTRIDLLLDNSTGTMGYYKELYQSIMQLHDKGELPKNVFQTDLLLGFKNSTIQKEIVETIADQLAKLTVFCRKNKNEALSNFIKQFYEKFEEEEIPLSIAVDAELGVGYNNLTDASTGNSELIDGLLIQDKSVNGEYILNDLISQFVEIKYYDYLSGQKKDIEITSEEIGRLREASPPIVLANSLSAFGNLLGENNILEKESFKFNLIAFVGPSAANLIGRFAYADEQINDLVRETCRQEELANPNAIYAEIVHLPQARIGNILLRPIFRAYEIPYIGISGVDEAHQIPMSDLYVKVRNGKLILTSRKLGRQVIPRLTTAHNFNYNSLPVYKLLCDLKYQDLNPTITWDWGPKANLPFLPRVSYNNIILKRAIWNIRYSEYKELLDQKGIPFSGIEDLRIGRNMPSRVLIVEGDNELLIDFSIRESVVMLYEKMKKKQTIGLAEFLFCSDNCIVKKAGEPYVNEVVIPLFKEETGSTGNVPSYRPNGTAKMQRKFYPNCNWLYVKIYAGSKSNDKILVEQMLPFLNELQEKNLVEKFFFIRYFDTQPHLRMRFLNSADPGKNILIQQRLLELLQFQIETNVVHKITIDTYLRELERYGYDSIELTEALFCNDSIAVLNLLNLLDGPESEYYRWMMAMIGINSLFDDFNLDLTEKVRLITRLQQAFFKEFGGSLSLQRQLSERYRKYQKDIFQYMTRGSSKSGELADVYAIIDIRSAQNLPIVRQILNELNNHATNILDTELLPSYIHMFMNRLFMVNQRRYELVMYDFLVRYYTSQLVINKKNIDA
jgi:thiopeptide-type bacteriocin biosynthesis protein